MRLMAPEVNVPRFCVGRVTAVTKTWVALTRRGVEPSLMVSYFPNGRPPLLALPSFVERRYAAAFLAFCDISDMLNDDDESYGWSF